MRIRVTCRHHEGTTNQRPASCERTNPFDAHVRRGVAQCGVDDAGLRRLVQRRRYCRERDDLSPNLWIGVAEISEESRAYIASAGRADPVHFTDADTQHTVRGTRWAGLQAITEYLDHHSPAKSDDVRAARVLTSHALGERKQRAYDLLATRS